MLIDKFIEAKPNIARTVRAINPQMSSAVVFLCDESAMDARGAALAMFKQQEHANLPTRLPYANICIHFTDTILWCAEISTSGSYRFVVQRLYQSAAGLARWPAYQGREGYMLCIAASELLGSVSTTMIGADGSDWGAIIDDRDTGQMNLWCGIIRRFLAFLACTNVRTLDGHPDAKLQKARKKRGKLPLVSYKVLQLRPAGGGTNDDPKHLWSNRVHLCRGHMAEYGVNGKGLLFGKYSGSFWIPPHVKGDKKQGLVVKDYQLPVEEQ